MSTPTPGQSSGRSSGGRRAAARPGRGRTVLDPTLVAAVLIPLVAIGLMLLASTEPAARPSQAATEAPLTRQTLVCPSALAGADPRATEEVLVATTAEAGGPVRLREDAGEQPDDDAGPRELELAPGRVASSESRSSLALTADGETAPGLLAARTGTDPLTAVECRAGSAETWFTGVGAGARHSSVVELTNPGSGKAVVEIEVLGPDGWVDADGLSREVPGGRTVRVDLAEQVPMREELALRVSTTRGRVVATVTDTLDRLGRSAPARDWLPAQAAPEPTSTLLGIGGSGSQRVLVLANPGADEVRAEVRLVTAETAFAAQGLEEVRVAPGGVAQVGLDGVLAEAEGVLGLQVSATGPVSATARSLVGGDLTHVVPGERLSEPSAALVPRGEKRLLLGAADAVGVVTLEAFGADGERLAQERVEVAPDRAVETALPAAAVRVRVTPQRAGVQAAVVVRGDGVATLALRAPAGSRLLPAVRPGLG